MGDTIRLLQPDRVEVRMKFVKNPAEYESVSAEIGLQTNVMKGEKISAAFERAASHVQAEYDGLLEEYARVYEPKRKVRKPR